MDDDPSIILFVSEFISGADLLRCRLNKHLKSTIESATNDARLWQPKCAAEFGLWSMCRPPREEHTSTSKAWGAAGRTYLNTYLKWRREFRGVPPHEVREVKKWWKVLEETLPIEILATLGPPADIDDPEVRAKLDAMPPYWRCLWRFKNGQRAGCSMTAGILGGHMVYDYAHSTHLLSIENVRFMRNEGLILFAKHPMPRGCFPMRDHTMKDFILDSDGTVHTHILEGNILLQCHPSARHGGWLWLCEYMRRLKTNVYRVVEPPSQYGMMGGGGERYISLVPWGPIYTDMNTEEVMAGSDGSGGTGNGDGARGAGTGEEEELEMDYETFKTWHVSSSSDSQSPDVEADAAVSTVGGGSSSMDGGAQGVEHEAEKSGTGANAISSSERSTSTSGSKVSARTDTLLKDFALRSSCPPPVVTRGVSLQVASLFMPNLSTVRSHGSGESKVLKIDAHYSYEVRMGLIENCDGAPASCQLTSRVWTFTKLAYDMRQPRKHRRTELWEDGTQIDSETIAGDGVVGMHPVLNPRAREEVMCDPFRYASFSGKVKAARPVHSTCCAGDEKSGITPLGPKTAIDRTGNFCKTKFSGELRFHHSGAELAAAIPHVYMDVPRFIY